MTFVETFVVDLLSSQISKTFGVTIGLWKWVPLSPFFGSPKLQSVYFHSSVETKNTIPDFFSLSFVFIFIVLVIFIPTTSDAPTLPFERKRRCLNLANVSCVLRSENLIGQWSLTDLSISRHTPYLCYLLFPIFIFLSPVFTSRLGLIMTVSRDDTGVDEFL